jgi:hypothetical protein
VLFRVLHVELSSTQESPLQRELAPSTLFDGSWSEWGTGLFPRLFDALGEDRVWPGRHLQLTGLALVELEAICGGCPHPTDGLIFDPNSKCCLRVRRGPRHLP